MTEKDWKELGKHPSTGRTAEDRSKSAEEGCYDAKGKRAPFSTSSARLAYRSQRAAPRLLPNAATVRGLGETSGSVADT